LEKDFVDKDVERAVREFPSIDPDVEAIVERICKINRYFDVAMGETLDGFDLNRGDYRLLMHMRSAGAPYEKSPSELADFLLVSSGSMTNRLDRLENRGLLTRRADPGDRRAVLVQLTDKGKSVIDDAVALQAKKESEIVGPLVQGDRDALMRSLRQLTYTMQERFGPPPRTALDAD
jgi:DNA-binding MarR family transcriptional regulator